jgi:adenosylcobinamide kinase/adenosylcobinamide-phosphate guanylyltransferase
MGKSILITGGARSGKSRIAEGWVTAAGAAPVYIATAQAFDDEMQARIDAHIARRGPEWTTVQDPLHLLDRLSDTDGTGPRLVDCLTLWLSNLMHDDADWHGQAQALAQAIPQQRSDVVFVTNEVGQGIVPENKLARAFRDAQGQLNQIIAAAVDEVYLAVAGYPLKVKPNA